jgi:hypothetical protein
LLVLVAPAGCEQQQYSTAAAPSGADEIQAKREGDPFYAHSYSWRSPASEPQTDDATVDVTTRRLDQDPENEQIRRFVEYLASIGFRFRYDVERREWQTAEPLVGLYAIRFSIGAFSPDSTLREMQMALMPINLAFGLNPDAHLAMSKPSLVRLTPNETDPRELGDALKSAPFQQAQDRLMHAFLDYRP